MYSLISDIVVEFNSRYSFLEKRCKKYIIEAEKADIQISVTDEEIERERLVCKHRESDELVEECCLLRKFAYKLPEFNAFLLHSAVFQVEGHGIALLARSGTGKTTHLKLWQELIAENMTIINGDKPIIRFFDDIPYAYGTPWCGKENYGINSRTRLTDICFIERSDTNFVDKIDKSSIVDLIMCQIILPDDTLGRIKTLCLLDKVIKSCNIWRIRCNMDIQAAKTAYNTIIGNKEN